MYEDPKTRLALVLQVTKKMERTMREIKQQKPVNWPSLLSSVRPTLSENSRITSEFHAENMLPQKYASDGESPYSNYMPPMPLPQSLSSSPVQYGSPDTPGRDWDKSPRIVATVGSNAGSIFSFGGGIDSDFEDDGEQPPIIMSPEVYEQPTNRHPHMEENWKADWEAFESTLGKSSLPNLHQSKLGKDRLSNLTPKHFSEHQRDQPKQHLASRPNWRNVSYYNQESSIDTFRLPSQERPRRYVSSSEEEDRHPNRMPLTSFNNTIPVSCNMEPVAETNLNRHVQINEEQQTDLTEFSSYLPKLKSKIAGCHQSLDNPYVHYQPVSPATYYMCKDTLQPETIRRNSYGQVSSNGYQNDPEIWSRAQKSKIGSAFQPANQQYPSHQMPPC
eukprot:Platyproteum_vivax@DN1641_c0_g1_i1.p1